jgi:hypothetical protein
MPHTAELKLRAASNLRGAAVMPAMRLTLRAGIDTLLMTRKTTPVQTGACMVDPVFLGSI